MTLSTYLFFAGECAAAFDLYAEALGGTVVDRSTYAELPSTEMPEGASVPADEADLIMHMTLQVGDHQLMGSDVSAAFGSAPEVGSHVALSVGVASREEAERVFAALLEGGTVQYPLADTFWGAYFGQGTDRFGVRWMVSFDGPREG
ncbi:MAG: VOC family protein [Rubricoccaceae bacterium]|nr:VOC family protein [Rubricoccaceae bacterium]